jgi:pyruvate/2-oxoglutarate dehydrogenase complex dihydrolipoamide dehydrogenase (E3) component
MAKYDFDILVIGAGPAGMAVSIMASEMGLNVCTVEKYKLGGECMSVGCIPSKAILRIAKVRNTFKTLEKYQLSEGKLPKVENPFPSIQKNLDYIGDAKTKSLFSKATVKMGKEAFFVDSHTVQVGDELVSAKKIFICAGTTPAVPPIQGLDKVDFLTNNNIFNMDKIPKSLAIIGGGAIGVEMAQTFSRLGADVSLMHIDEHLLPSGDPQAAEIINGVFSEEGIKVYNKMGIDKIQKSDGLNHIRLQDGTEIKAEKILVAAGRKHDYSRMKLDACGVQSTPQGIPVNKNLQTNVKHIYAVGDCNGQYLLSHAAMHQGMCALMNVFLPWPLKRKYKNFVVPWTVFTEPQVSFVGKTEKQLQNEGIKYEVIQVNYEDYGAAIAEGIGIGYVKALVSSMGKVYGVSIVGEGSGEMINEWGLVIQNDIRLTDVMFLQHSFPTMSFLNKRISETWMMKKFQSSMLRRMVKTFFKFRTLFS